MQFRLGLAVLGLLLSPIPAAAHQADPVEAAAPVSKPAAKQTLTVANANVREGARSRPLADLRVGHDRRELVRRLMKRASRVPGVVLLQETYGSARRYVKTLNRHPRAKRAGARYRLAVRPSLRSNQHRCGPTKRRRHQRVQTSTIIVNRAKVRRVVRRGTVAGWGRWNVPGQTKTVDHCAYQPWVLLRLRSGGLLRIAGTHIAPLNVRLKTRALRRLSDRLHAMHSHTPGAQLVIAGDLNMTRQPRRYGQVELADGRTVREAHRLLERRGLSDANRLARPRGREGVIGYVRRVDFIYTTTRVADAAFDRCYRGYRGGRACPPSARVFRTHKRFAPCQWQADSGKRRVRCPKNRYRRYYSDHAMVTARLRW